MARDTKTEEFDLMDFVLYAPIGLLYEYRKIVPQLIKRGKSQVQLGMFFGRMAASKGTSGAERMTADALTTMATIAARGITEFGQVVGLAPPDDDAPPLGVAPQAATISEIDEAREPTAEAKPAKKPPARRSAAPAPRLPIAGYDQLTAREIVSLLDDLTPAQRTRIRHHETGNRNRKTVLAKLDRLDDSA